jgi:pyruvate dehydrogenase E1 component alpha subunit
MMIVPGANANRGNGRTGEGDFHESLNFAGIFHFPVVFFVQKN